ncbi:MAG: VOC family protein [Leptolyngbyaceae bacterium]|nr:VOC family protein [Leptolyngbyaceae bacterium]
MPLECRDAFVALAATEFDASVKFYQDVFGDSPRPYLTNRYAEFHLPGMKIGLFKPQDSHIHEFSRSAGAGLSLCVEVTDLEGAIAHIQHLGYETPSLIHTASHGREAYVYDPGGNRIILHEASATRDA